MDGGGGSGAGGGCSLGGTAGQPDPGMLTGGTYTLGGGFWGGGVAARWYGIFLPVVTRGAAR